MKKAVAIVLALFVTASGVWAQQPLRVTRVLLYKNGMAYIVRTGTQFGDQERLRENLKALRTGTEDQQMRSRYLGQLRKQEDQIDAARARIASLNTQIVTLQSQVNDAMANLTWN